MPVDRVVSEHHIRNWSLGWLGMSWIEHFCVHGPGDIMGTAMNPKLTGTIPLSDEQAALMADSYALDGDGRRLYDSVFYSRPKGASKSAVASWIGLFEALGPCRFGGYAEGGEVYRWRDFTYKYRKGEPMGRAVTYPFLRLLATEEGQVGNTYSAIYFNLKEGPLSESLAKADDAGITRIFLPNGGEIRPSTASSSAKDGGKETWVNFDETHLYLLPELHRMHETVRRNLAKRKSAEPWSFETSTMYEPGMNSVAEASHYQAQMIKQGKVKKARMLFDHREAPPILQSELGDEDKLRAALVEAYGDAAAYMDFDRIIAEIWDTRNDANNSRRYFLNQVTAASDSWISPHEWDALKNPMQFIPEGALITLGMDGSKSEDWTALIATDVESGYQWPLGIWDPGEGEINREEVDFAVRKAFQEFDVVGFLSDVEHWESYVDKWNAELGRNLCVESTPKNSIAWDMRGRRLQTVQMIEAFHAAIIDQVVTHSGDPTHAQHMYNARRRPNQYGIDIGKEAQHSPKKIDAAVASCLSWQGRRLYQALDKNKQRRVRTGRAVFA